METFTKENCEKLEQTCKKIVSLLQENVDGKLMAVQLMFLGENIKEFVNNPIILNSGIHGKEQ